MAEKISVPVSVAAAPLAEQYPDIFNPYITKITSLVASPYTRVLFSEDRAAHLLSGIEACTSVPDFERIKLEAFGSKAGFFPLSVNSLSSVPPEQKKIEGLFRNAEKKIAENIAERKKAKLERAALDQRLEAERVDVTLPCRHEELGRVHPVSQTLEEMIEIFAQWGFTLAEGPQIENDDYNFTKLNVPPDHPARQMQDTFYMPDAADGQKRVLRTHTSPVQVRTMLTQKPPIRILAPGRVYRCDFDATHAPMFHQVEGLVIEETGKITMAHLKGVLLDFCRTYFGITDLPLRFRPSFFPFTEPSAEVDVGCSRKGGELKLGNYGDWLEVLGCGMVHPNVLRSVGIDPEKYSGFAFGMGVERLTMLRYGVNDLRAFFENDLRFLKQFK